MISGDYVSAAPELRDGPVNRVSEDNVLSENYDTAGVLMPLSRNLWSV